MLGEAVCEGLRQDGYIVDWVSEAGSARAALLTTSFAALVLDLGLPKGDGESVLRWLRARGHSLPVIITSARDRLVDRISGLDAGADDYLVKPFDLDELTARLRAVTRRAAGCAQAVIKIGELSLDPQQKLLTHRGAPVVLTGREYALVASLMRSDRPLSRVDLEEQLYSFDDEIASNTVEVYIHRLRRKLGGEVIRYVKGRGYCVRADA
jgi:two-component system response regulator QseB